MCARSIGFCRQVSFFGSFVDRLVEGSDPPIGIPEEADEQVRVARGANPTIKLLLTKDIWQPAMTAYSQVLLSIAISLSIVTPSTAAEITYSDYAKAPDAWKRGFVFGISQYLSAVAQPDEEPPYPVRSAYQRCLAGPTDAILARHLDGYVARNPPSPKEPMIRIALRAMFDLCRSEIEKAQPSQVRPAR